MGCKSSRDDPVVETEDPAEAGSSVCFYAFQGEKEAFSPETSGISSQRTVFAQYPVTGYQDGDGIVTYSASYRSWGGGDPPFKEFFRKSAVACSHTVRDLKEQFPYLMAKPGAVRVQRRKRGKIGMREIGVKPGPCFTKY